MTVALHRDHLAVAPCAAGQRPGSPAVNDTDDAVLLDRARAGDRAAEELIYRRHVRYVGAVALHVCGRHQDAEDIVQETFTLALSRLDQLREPAAMRGWLARIAVSLCQRRVRRRKLLRFVGLDDGADDAPLHHLCAHDAAPDVRAELARVQSVLAAAPDGERVAWLLHRVEGETLESVASMCGCSLATVKRRVAAVSERLQRALGEEGAR